MSVSYKELIRSRKSVRTFDGRVLSSEDREKLESYIIEMTNPFDVPVRFRLLKAKDHGLSSPVIVGADEYLAAKVERLPNYEMAFGYSFEKVCLYAASLGIGTVMLAASLSRSAFEKAMQVVENEVLPVASPVGYPAEKRSLRESLMRKGLKADDRKSFDTLYFDETFDKPLTEEKAGIFAEALDLARLAPSAGNQQPWRAIVSGNKVHFYEKQSMKENALGDIQKVDIGIALCHFDLVMNENGEQGKFVLSDPGISLPEKIQYMISYEVSAEEKTQ